MTTADPCARPRPPPRCCGPGQVLAPIAEHVQPRARPSHLRVGGSGQARGMAIFENPHVVLVPGFWLGAWAWDDVVGPLRDAGLEPHAVTLPGLASWAALEAVGTSAQGLDDGMRAAFRARAVPHPAGPAREPVRVSDPRRLDVPVTAICSSLPSEVLRTLAHPGPPLHTELGDLDVTYVDVPTGHWPMLSRPSELAAAIVAAASSARA